MPQDCRKYIACVTHDGLYCRAIYDQSYEDIAWHVGDNNGMPSDPQRPMSDLAHSIAQHDDPHPPDPTPDPTPSTSGRNSSDSRNEDRMENDSEKGSISSRVQSAIRQAAHMDSVAEGEQAKKDKRWQRNSALQTIALDSQDLPDSPSSHKVSCQTSHCPSATYVKAAMPYRLKQAIMHDQAHLSFIMLGIL